MSKSIYTIPLPDTETIIFEGRANVDSIMISSCTSDVRINNIINIEIFEYINSVVVFSKKHQMYTGEVITLDDTLVIPSNGKLSIKIDTFNVNVKTCISNYSCTENTSTDIVSKYGIPLTEDGLLKSIPLTTSSVTKHGVVCRLFNGTSLVISDTLTGCSFGLVDRTLACRFMAERYDQYPYTDSTQTIVVYGDTSIANNQFGLRIESTGILSIIYGDNNVYATPLTIKYRNWYTVIVMIKNKKLYLIVNGHSNQITTADLSIINSAKGDTESKTLPINIGGVLDTNANKFKGYISAVKVFNRALTNSEIETYNNEYQIDRTTDGTVLDLRLSDNIGSETINEQTDSSGVSFINDTTLNTNVAYLSGSSSYISLLSMKNYVPNCISGGAMCIWFKADELVTGSNNQTLIAIGIPTGGDRRFMAPILTSDNKLHIHGGNDSWADLNATYPGRKYIPMNKQQTEWNFFGMSFDKQWLYVFLNGEMVFHGVMKTWTSTFTATSCDVGACPGNGFGLAPFKGRMRAFKLFNKPIEFDVFNTLYKQFPIS